MCKSMTDFNELVKEIQEKKAELSNLKIEIQKKEDELKAYMRKRRKEELLSENTGLLISFKTVETPKFNKDLFVETNGMNAYQKYMVVSTSQRLCYLKSK